MTEARQKRAAARAASPLPSRYDDILDQRLEHARQVLQQAHTAQRRPIRWKRSVAAFGLLGVVLAAWATRDDNEPARGSLPFDRAAVVSADTLGLGVHAGEFVKVVVDATPMPAPTPAPTAAPSPRPRLRSIAAKAVTEPRLPHDETLEEDLDLGTLGVYVTALEDAAPVLLPPGTRLAALLTGAVTTGPVSAPASATVVEDVILGGRTVLPAGALLVGEAFATRSDDRVQMAFQSLVRDGGSVPIRAVALGADGQVGLAGTVVRKGSKAKKGLGKVLGSVASTLTLGAVGGGGPAEAVADGLLASGAHGLNDLDRAWAAERSDKVVRVAPGTRLVAWIQTEARLP